MSLDLGKSGSYMRSISIGKALPSMHEFLRICEYLGVTPQEFFTGAGDETDRINIFNRLQDLDDGDIQKLQTFLGWILGVSVRDAFRFERDERPLSKKTIREYVLFANQVLHFANERYHSVQAEFKMPAKGARPRFVDCIHEDEVCKLMSEIDKCSMPEQAIVLSLLNTGVRRAELAGLTWSDFDFKECTVHVNKSLLVFRDFGYQHTATKESNDRYIDVAPEYMEFMQQYKEWWYTKKRLMGASWQRDMVKTKRASVNH